VWAESVAYDGLIEPYAVVDVGSPAEGIVETITVDRSSPVQAGQTLVALESSVESRAVAKAKAAAAFDGDIGLQQTQLAFAKRNHDRVRSLAAVSKHDKDQAATDVALTRYRLEKAREHRALAELELAKARAILARRTIKSPISGVVVERYVSPGEYVNTQPLLRVAQTDPLRVEVIVPARIFGRITPGMRAAIVPELSVYGEHTATVTLVDQVIDAASSTFGVRLELPNAEARIPSGLKCVVRFDLDAPIEALAQASERLDTEAPAVTRSESR
jgi:RND family efflux transporter MFP subunit